MSEALGDRIRRGDPRAVARGLTIVESETGQAAALLSDLRGAVGRAHRVGVTGPPGAGKSTLVSALAGSWRRLGRRVGILAVDPTSPFTGGALLGDRIRMAVHSGDEGVFIRSLATRGALGGLSPTTQDAADVLDAAGYDPVLVETVGVGQGEVEIVRAADTTVVVLAPGAGDEVQGMKAGLLEIADVVVVNQADREGADRLAAALEAAFALRAGPPPPIVTTVATSARGVDELRARIDARTAGGVPLGPRRLERAKGRIRARVEAQRARDWWATREEALARWALEVVEGRETVAGAVGRLLAPAREAPGAEDVP